MSTPYSAIEPYVQGYNEAGLDTVNIGVGEDFEAVDIGPKLAPREQRGALFARFNAAPDSSVTIHAILNEWLTGCYDEEIAIGWLCALKLLQEPQEADCYEAMCNLAFFELGPVALPERRTAPIPSVSSSQPFAPLSQTDGGACNG